MKMDPSKRMTVDEALNHPWIVRYSSKKTIDEERQDMSSEVEGAHVKRSGKSRKGIRRKLRISMFGV